MNCEDPQLLNVTNDDQSRQRVSPSPGLVWSKFHNEWIHPRSAFAIVEREHARRMHSRFDVGHEMVLPERGRKAAR